MVYASPGEAFLSPSPRQYVQFHVTLSTEDPTVAPVLHSISLDYHDPLIRKGAQGEVTPRESELGIWQVFLYRIKPTFTPGDAGFDGVLIKVASDVREVSVQIGAQEISGSEAIYTVQGDSLLLELPKTVTRDSVSVRFQTRILENPTVFEAFLLNSRKPGVWQGVKPVGREAISVFLPSVPLGDRLIRNISIAPYVITPNGDEIHDVMNLSFDLAKVSIPPEVSIYSLQGERIKELVRQDVARYVYLWDGRDRAGALVPPGIYGCRIEVHAEISTQTVHRIVSVVY